MLLNSSGRVQHRSLRLRRERLQHCRHVRYSYVFFPDQYIFHFLFQHFNNDLQELHLCDCRPVHHGSWLPVTLDHPHLSNGGQSNLSRADGDRIQQTHKNFPQKNRCDHQTNLFDLRSCLQMRKFEVVHKPSGGPAFSPELLSTQSLGFCSATRL